MIKFIKEESKLTIPISFLFSYFSVSSSGYYFWLKRAQGLRFTKKQDICNEIKKLFKLSKETYGAPRIYQELKQCSRERERHRMKVLGLKA